MQLYQEQLVIFDFSWPSATVAKGSNSIIFTTAVSFFNQYVSKPQSNSGESQ